MPRVDPDKAAGALLGLALGGDDVAIDIALRLASSVIERGGYDADSASRLYADATDFEPPSGIEASSRPQPSS